MPFCGWFEKSKLHARFILQNKKKKGECVPQKKLIYGECIPQKLIVMDRLNDVYHRLRSTNLDFKRYLFDLIYWCGN